MTIVFCRSNSEKKYFGDPDIEPEGSPLHSDQEAPGPSETSASPSDVKKDHKPEKQKIRKIRPMIKALFFWQNGQNQDD